MKKIICLSAALLLIAALAACSPEHEVPDLPSEPESGTHEQAESTENQTEESKETDDVSGLPIINAGETATELSIYMSKQGGPAYIPKDFTVSDREGETNVAKGLVVIGPDGSEYVWIPTSETELARRDFGSYFSSYDSFASYFDETDTEEFRSMAASVEKYGGFYFSRYEVSQGKGDVPLSVPVTEDNPGTVWVRFSPQDSVKVCSRLYEDNDTVTGFFPYGCNYDTVLQWLVDSGCLDIVDVKRDSTSWGNYSNDTFSEGARGNYTGKWEEAKTNNIYDLAGNNWEWTRERSGSNYVMRGGGYNLMGGDCQGYIYPAAIRDPLPGNNHHPNVAFRSALFIN